MNDFLATLDISIKPKQSFSKEIIRKVNFLMKYPGKKKYLPERHKMQNNQIIDTYNYY